MLFCCISVILGYLYSLQTRLHFVQRKNCVGGSSAARVCCNQYHACLLPHLGQSRTVIGKGVSSFSRITTPFVFFFSSTIFRFLTDLPASYPQCRHFIITAERLFCGTRIEPHFLQNSIPVFGFSLFCFRWVLLCILFLGILSSFYQELKQLEFPSEIPFGLNSF